MEVSSILNTINILLIIAISQGFFITFFIFHKHHKLYPNRFLGSLMLVFSLTLLHIYLGEQAFYNRLMIGELLTPTIFLLGPLHFLYAKYLIHQPNRIHWKEYVHFVPTLLLMMYAIVHSLDATLLPDLLSERKKTGFIAINWLYFLNATVYYLLTIKHLRWYSSRIRDVFSNIEAVRLSWLRKLTFIAIGIHLIFLTENILSLIDLNITGFYLSSLLSAIYVYTMGYIGISKSPILNEPTMSEITEDLPTAYSSHREIKYQRSGLRKDQALEHKEGLLKLMEEEQMYKDSSLTLGQLAEKLSITSHHLSEIINTQLGKNFYDFVNAYRVDDVINNLANDDKKHLTLLAIGMEAGFNSKSTFNTVFKKFTGKTPSQYRSTIIKSS